MTTAESTALPPKYLQQEESLAQEFNSLISSLPKAKGWLATNLYQYQGFWYPARYIQGLISCQRHFHPQESDIFLVSTPKSGTTWLKALMFTVINRHRYPIDDKNHPLLNKNPHELVHFLEIKLYIDEKIPNLDSFSSPRIFATHLPYQSLPEEVRNRCKMVYLCRNVKDIFVSLWHFTNKLRLQEMETKSIEEVFDSFCNGVSLYGPLWDHALEYWKRSKENTDRILFLRYEEMKEQPGIHLRRMAGFLDCPFSVEEEELGIVDEILKLCSFETLSGLTVNKSGKLESGEKNNSFFRRGKVGDWKNYMSDEMRERLDRITEEKLRGSGLML